MPTHGWFTRLGRSGRPVAMVAVGSAMLMACSRPADVQVRTASAVRPPARSAPVTIFQGEVASVDAGAGAFVVAAHLVWAPAVQTVAEQRRVTVGPSTVWPGEGGGLSTLPVGAEVQVKAEPAAGGTWLALEVQPVDVD